MIGNRSSSMLVAAILAMGLLAASCQGKREQAPPKAEAASSPQATAQASEPARQTPVPAVAEAAAEPADAMNLGKGLATLESAAAAGKYLFVFYYRDDQDEQTRKMRTVFEGAMKRLVGKAESVAIDADDPSEERIVARFDVSRAPMPLLLAVAPNGVVTGGFPTTVSEEQIVESMASPGMQQCLKALRQRKLVLLCVQNGSTAFNEEAMVGVREFMADPRFGRSTEIVTVDPADKEEAKALERLQVDTKAGQAVTVLLAPPGSAIAKFQGKTTKDMLTASLTQASSGCGPGGCGPGGCGPKTK